ncbi:MAG: hypothetical protein WBC16_01305, partial [Candidatus Omnitrophota bacterium]
EGVSQLYAELSERGIDLHPPCYLADEWLCPDGEPVIGIPFFLAHPRLRKLEYKMDLEVEGGTKADCMKLLRHEMGHALNYAYMLYKRKRWQNIFGPFSKDYPERYKYRPYSKNYVIHLERWYAQYHPDEDFAETFAVWVDPQSDWKEKYKGWKALRKLEYVDKLMKEIAGRPPKKAKGEKYWAISRLRATLKTHYKKKKRLYADYYSDFHDINLNKIFIPGDEKTGMKAYVLIRKHRKEILNYVALWSGEKKYIINELLKDLVERCKELGLKAGPDEMDTVLKVSVYVTAQTMNYHYAGRYRRER